MERRDAERDPCNIARAKLTFFLFIFFFIFFRALSLSRGTRSVGARHGPLAQFFDSTLVTTYFYFNHFYSFLFHFHFHFHFLIALSLSLFRYTYTPYACNWMIRLSESFFRLLQTFIFIAEFSPFVSLPLFFDQSFSNKKKKGK